MPDVFISYASEDRDRARQLAHALEANGWSVWWDRKIVPGQTFDQVIERELDEAGSVIVLWSKNSVGSEWVKNEAAVGAERGVLVPARIANVRLPLAFRRKQTADLTRWDGKPTDVGFQALCAGVAETLGKAMPPLPKSPPHKKREGSRLWLLGAAVIAALIASIGIYWFYSSQAPIPGPRKIVETPREQILERPGLRQDVLRELGEKQREAVGLLARDSVEAIPLIDENFSRIDKALERFGASADFLVLRGYAAKDVYQSSKEILSEGKRHHYLMLARESFEEALRLDPENAGAHNGMGNVFFFEGDFDAAIEQHEKALRLTHGNYPAAEHDKELAERVKAHEIPFDF